MDTKTPKTAPRIPGSRPYKTAGAASLVSKEKGMSCLWVALAFLPGLTADHRLSEKQIEYYLSGSREEHGICCALFFFLEVSTDPYDCSYQNNVLWEVEER